MLSTNTLSLYNPGQVWASRLLGVPLTSCKVSSKAANCKLHARRSRPGSWVLPLAPPLPLERYNPGLQKVARPAHSAVSFGFRPNGLLYRQDWHCRTCPNAKQAEPNSDDRSAVCKIAEGEAHTLKYSAQTHAFILRLTSLIGEPLSSNLAINSQEGSYKFHQKAGTTFASGFAETRRWNVRCREEWHWPHPKVIPVSLEVMEPPAGARIPARPPAHSLPPQTGLPGNVSIIPKHKKA